MGLPTVILGAPSDRRVFDLYNQLVKEYPLLLWSKTYAVGTSLLYPRAAWIKKKNMGELLQYIRDNPAKQYIWIPLDEDDITYLLDQTTIPQNLAFLLPEKQHFALARDKMSFTSHFMAKRLTPRCFTREELMVEFPLSGVVVKPAKGKGSIGRRYIQHPSQLGNLQPGDLIQERVGEGKEVIGAFFLCKNGEVLGHYQHRRIRTFPEDGGTSCCAETTMISQVAEAGTAIMKALNWSGLAMIEFLKHPVDHTYLAIECNPRVWGTVLLSEFSRHHLVLKYIDLCMGREVRSTIPMPQAKIRWYFPYELMYFLRAPIANHKLLSWNTPDTCYIGGTGAGWVRSILFVLFSFLQPGKWVILFKKMVTAS